MESKKKIKKYIKNIISEKFLEDLLYESILSRIWQYLESDKKFGIISPFRKYLSEEENNNRYIELKKIVRNELKLGYIEMEGGFKEEGDWIKEKSLFIPSIKKETLIELGVKYDQFSVIYKDNNEFVEIGTNKKSGIGKILNNFIKQGWDKNIDINSELTKQFFLSLIKGKHKDKRFLFNIDESYLYELMPFSFNEMAYGKNKKQNI